MSYILEALRKSSEERARLTPAGASTTPAPVVPVRALPAPRRSLRMLGLSGLLVVAGVALLVDWPAYWPVFTSPPEQARSSLAAAELAPSQASGSAQEPAVVPAATPDTRPPKKNSPERVADAVPAKTPPKAQPEPVATPAASASVNVPASSPVNATISAPSHAPSASPAMAAAPVPAPPPRANAASAVIAPPAAPVAGAATDMPPELLKQVLAVPVSAHVYSSKPAERMVIIDGRAVREGDALASGMTVDQITPSGIAVSYKGYHTNKPVGR